MFGFVKDGERVGEDEFTRMQAKELMKQQIKMVSETLVDQNQVQHSGKANRLAKQVLRIIATCSFLTLVDAQEPQYNTFPHAERSFEAATWALGRWSTVVSPISIIFVFCIVMVGMIIFFMARSEGEVSEDHVDEDESSESESLPAGVDVVSRYPMHDRSLGQRYYTVFRDLIFKPEGILLWMHQRCEERVNRGIREVRNTVRKHLLTCLDGASMQRWVGRRQVLQHG